MTDKFYAVFPPQSDIKSERNAAFNITRLTSFDNLLFIGCREGLLLQSVFEETEENVTCYSFSLIISRKVTLAVCLQASTLNIYRITRSRCDVTYSVQLPSLAPVMLCATDFLVFATPTHYFCLDFKTKRINELFARTEKHVKPLIAQVSEVSIFKTFSYMKTEFLLSGPGALGIFVDSTGASQRPPIPLSSNLSSLFCYDSLIFAIDDEFVSIHSTKNQEQLQTLVVKNTSAACMSLDGKRLFLAPRQAVRSPQIYTVRSETWDMVARRLILAGCTTEAQDCVQRQYRRLLDLCAERPATSSTAKILFTARSKRVFTLMGFYFFEIGRLQEAKQFFEKSSLNVCELLYRYVDLLPRGYTFTPSDDLNVSVAVQAQVENTATASPNTIFDLAESLASRSKDSDSCVREYRIFLLDFLLEHRRSRIFEKHTQAGFGAPDAPEGSRVT
ncbi:transforming growth factor, beta receptor associated protein 1 [Sparganum proliferum]